MGKSLKAVRFISLMKRNHNPWIEILARSLLRNYFTFNNLSGRPFD